MPDMQSQITAAQAAYDKSREVYEPLVDAEQATHTAYNNALGSGNQAQITATKAAWDNAQAQVQISVTSMNNALFNLQGLRDAYNTGLAQSTNPAQQQAIASDAFTGTANAFRDDTYTAALGAANDSSTNPIYLDFLKDTAITAEQGYQTSLGDAGLDSDIATVQVASSLNLPDINDVIGTDLLNFDDGSGGDTPVDTSQVAATGNSTVEDNRLRIKPFSGSISDFVADAGVLAPLSDTNGVIFPYTPSVHFANKANYQQVSPTHANTDYWVYQNSPAISVTIEGQFTAQTEDEAKYLLAAAHFFRAATKMRFGAKDPDRGFGPPVLKLYGYGTMTLKALPIVIINFQEDLPNNVNYVEVTTDKGKQWVPSLTTFQIEGVVQQTPAQHRDEFTWDDFASGKLMDKGGWI
jgi:hypothetical protein